MRRVGWVLFLVCSVSCTGASKSTPASSSASVAEKPEHPVCGSRSPDTCFSEERAPFSAYNDWNRLVPVYEYACQSGVHEACGEYGEFWYAYTRETRDTPALQQLEVACEAGDAKSCLYAGIIADSTSRPLLERGCELGNGLACLHIATMLYLRNRDEALPYYERACELGDGSGCGALAGLVEDPAKKAELKRQACEHEVLMCEPDTDLILDECLTRGFGCYGLLFLAGIPEEEQAVINTLERACQRQASMCVVLGEVHTSHRVSSANRDKAIEYFERACVSDERYVLEHVDKGCARWVELTCVEDGVCTAETLEVIGGLDDFYRLPYEVAFHCHTGDAAAAADASAACDCGLVCEDGVLYQDE